MWKATAPANIALIKYMGKTQGNRPTNASLSFTLDNFVTEVRLQKIDEPKDAWKPLAKDGFSVRLSLKGEERFLKFFAWLKQERGLQGNFLIESANNFPSDCGLASSASSFAALVKVTEQAALDNGRSALTAFELSRLARHGSGSSCRSFFKPWSIWQMECAEPIELPYGDMIHQVAMVESAEKEVSSSKAHILVTESALFAGRAARAENRLAELIHALRGGDWKAACDVTWQEFWDMHALFETSAPPFGYMRSGSLEALQLVREMWQREGDGPMATMDAGPNVHLLYRPDQKEMALRMRQSLEKIRSARVLGDDIKTV